MADEYRHAPASDRPAGTTSVEVRVVIFRWVDCRLDVALDASGHLPAAIPQATASLEDAADQLIVATAGEPARYTEQLYTFSSPDRDHRSVVVSYMALFSPEQCTAERDTISWTPVDSAELPHALQREMLDYARLRLRAKLGYTNIAFHLMPRHFTISELHQTYETILGQPVDKRNFRRRMTASGILIDTKEQRRDGSHRPAALYRFSEEEDDTAYLTPPALSIASNDRPSVENPRS